MGEMNLRAMVIDDSAIMRKLVMRSLSESGLANFIFAEAEDGVDALQKFDSDRVDILFVDWNMPRMSGIELIRQVRARQKRRIPIVMITTESTMEKVQEALDEVQVDAFVIKPFTVELLQKNLSPLFARVGGFFGELAGKPG